MNNFELSSQKERRYTLNLLKNNGIKEEDINFSPIKGNDQYDGTFKNSKGREILFEVKVRNINSFAYKTTIIEESKFNFLLNKAKNDNTTPYIIIFFTDGKVLMQNLFNCQHRKVQKYAPKTTAENNGTRLKTFIEINIENQNLINYTN